ncbi:hypothetical protein V6N13_042218 [Hibiscus sabdariffa]
MPDSCKMTIDMVESLPSSLDRGDGAFAMGLENKLQENDTEEMSRQGKKKRKAPKAGKSSKKRCRTDEAGEPSEALQQPDSAMELELESQQQACDTVQNKVETTIPEQRGNEKPVRVLLIIEKKSPPQVLQILRDRDQSAYMLSRIQAMKLVIKYDIKSLFSTILEALGKVSTEVPGRSRSDLTNIQKDIDEELKTRQWFTQSDLDNILKELNDGQWPIASDLNNIMKNIGRKQNMNEQATLFVKMFQNFEAIEQRIEESDKKLAMDWEKADEVAEFFLVELSAVSPNPALKEHATYNIPEECLAAASLHKGMEDLKTELFDENKCKVKVADFHGLQDAINSGKDRIPDHLKPIAVRIEQDRGECTPDNEFYQQLLVLVSAAVKEMEDTSDSQLNMSILRKWAATFNLANRMQFQVPFFKSLLLKNMLAYLPYSILNPGLEI